MVEQAVGKQVNIARVSDGAPVNIRATADGALFAAPWYIALLLEGRVFGANSGTLSTGIAGAVFGATTPDMAIDTPAGGQIALLPLHIHLSLEMDWNNATDAEGWAAVSTTRAAADGTLAIKPLRTDGIIPTACAGEAATVADVTTDAGYFEFFRVCHALPEATEALDAPIVDHAAWNWYATQGIAPLLAGAGSLVLWMACTSDTQFTSAIWAELPVSAL